MALGSNIGKERDKRARKSSQKADAAGMNAAAPTKRKRRRPQISTIVAMLIMVIGLGVIGYPTFSDWWNSYHQSRAIANYVQAVEQTDPKVIEGMLNDAHAYNQRLLSKGNRYMMSDAEVAEYNSLLNLGGDGVMGYIQISTIGVNLPIYHGVEESVLQVAIGHIQGTSLPVGGASTHAAVSGHRGLPSAKLFTDLDQLVEGDTFTITILNETITYLIDQIRIVEPEDMSDLNITQGEDYVTLITCTPYGINTHRLLVRGHRIENLADALAIPPEAVQIPNYIAVPAVAIPMLFVYLIGTLIYLRVRHPEYDRDKVLQEIRELEGTKGAKPKGAEAAAEAETVTEEPAEAETVTEEPAEAEEPAESEMAATDLAEPADTADVAEATDAVEATYETAATEATEASLATDVAAAEATDATDPDGALDATSPDEVANTTDATNAIDET